jgi:hypothetical protein
MPKTSRRQNAVASTTLANTFHRDVVLADNSDMSMTFPCLSTARATRFALVILCLTTSPAHALDPHRAITQYVHDVWYAKDGLPQNSVHAIVQTRDGYLWFGTEEGLTRFDGVTFTVFDRSNTPAIRSNQTPCRRGG